MRSLLRRPAFAWPLAVLAVIVVFALAVPVLAGGDPRLTDFAAAYQPPSAAHWFGTDSAGRDLFERTAAGLRVSLIIAAVCAVSSTVLGLAVGVAAGAIGGRTDEIVMRLVDGINALPHLLLGIVIVVALATVVGSLLADVAYAVLDPRVRYQKS